ncbi:MAG: methylmalonyl-CoA mutase family protein [Phycisphaerales bacterium]
MSHTQTTTGPRIHATPADVDPHAVTISGIVLNPVYDATTSTPSLDDPAEHIPPPGQFPYTRGLFPQGYRTRLWTMRQFAGFGSATNAQPPSAP